MPTGTSRDRWFSTVWSDPLILRRAASLLVAAAIAIGPHLAQEAAPEETIATRIELLSTELARAGSGELRSRLTEGLGNLWVLRSRELIAAGDEAGAIAGYERALSFTAGHPIALVELGWLELRAGRTERARSLSETGLAAAPDNPWLRELRGEVLYRDGRLADAIADFEAALAGRTDDERLAAKIAKARRELEAERNHERRLTGRFTLSYDGDRDDTVGRLLLDVLEDALPELATELDAYPQNPVAVVIYTRKQFHATTATGSEVAGLYDGKIRLPAGGLDRVTPALVRVARHELVHALIASKGPGEVPRWLHEGLAQLLEPRDPKAADARAARGGTPSLDPFAYEPALSFTAFLDREYSRSRLLWLVDLLAGGAAEDDAFVRALGQSKQEVVASWQRSIAG